MFGNVYSKKNIGSEVKWTLHQHSATNEPIELFNDLSPSVLNLK